MVAVPDQLVWEITKKNHAFLKSKNGRSKRSGQIKFSSEPGNLKNLHTLQYSGIANSPSGAASTKTATTATWPESDL